MFLLYGEEIMHYAIKQGCQYSRFYTDSAWCAFYHDEGYSSGSGPSKTSQKLALWYKTQYTDWPYLGLKGMTTADIQNHYHCSDEELIQAVSYIALFFKDVEKRFV
jgi:hypothetical protein